MDSEILKDVWPPVPKHIETKVAELEAKVERLEKARRAANHHPDCNYWRWEWEYSWAKSDCTCAALEGKQDG